MADVLNRRNALLGWLVWKLAKRKLRQKLRPENEPPRRHVLRAVAAVAVLAALAAAWARRASGPGGDTGGGEG